MAPFHEAVEQIPHHRLHDPCDHGGNIQVLSHPGGWPLWTFGVRPGCEHDTTCAKAEADLLSALEKAVAEEDLLTLTDLGHENLSPAMRHPAKKPCSR